MSNHITVMLVDDHAVVRAGYRMLLTQSEGIDVICEAATGEEACQQYQASLPRVVVMDLNLPGIGGLAATRRILIFSMYDEIVYENGAMRPGAGQ